MNRTLYPYLIAATILLGAQVPAAVKASTLSYNVTLTAISGPESGTGSFTITAPITPPVGIGYLTSLNGGLTAMDFKIGSFDFSLNSLSEIAYYYQGSSLVLAALIYAGQSGPSQLFSFSLGSIGLYNFTDAASTGYNTYGSISVSQTPLPTTLPLFATGLGVLAVLGWRRKRKVGLFLAN